MSCLRLSNWPHLHTKKSFTVNSFNLFIKKFTKYYISFTGFQFTHTQYIKRNYYCHYSEQQIFLLFFQSLSSWMKVTCRDVEDVWDEQVRYDPREGTRNMCHSLALLDHITSNVYNEGTTVL